MRIGDLALVVAALRYARGGVLWMETSRGVWRPHTLLQERERSTFPWPTTTATATSTSSRCSRRRRRRSSDSSNLGGSLSRAESVGFVNPDLGSAGLVKTDLDRDGDVDLLLPVGDNLEDQYSYPQPYHGCFS